jgi:adenine phosphoribosyltransferase
MSNTAAIDLRQYIREIPNFPKPGINFKDITPLLADPVALAEAMRQMAERYKGMQIDMVIAAEARGFIFATPLAIDLKAGFVPIRKPGKLPFQRHTYSYELEYGTDTLEMHIDGIEEGQNVLIVDDLLATGGTVSACCKMVEQCKANIVGCAFLIELAFLGGAKRLEPYEVQSLIRYE